MSRTPSPGFCAFAAHTKYMLPDCQKSRYSYFSLNWQLVGANIEF